MARPGVEPGRPPAGAALYRLGRVVGVGDAPVAVAGPGEPGVTGTRRGVVPDDFCSSGSPE